MSGRTIEASGLSEAWLDACRALLAQPGRAASHLVARIQRPLPENDQIRAGVDDLLSAGRHQPVDEVRNTIFPAALAKTFRDPDKLISEYLEDYRILRGLGSPQGTYFGRICEYPEPDGSRTPQLAKVVGKLGMARAGTRWRAVYQLNIYAPHRDMKKLRGFPCMAHLSFQLSGNAEGETEQLDCLANYRYQDMILKGYGNFLGLAELQRYVAERTGFATGELTVVAGHAMMTLSTPTRDRLNRLLAT